MIPDNIFVSTWTYTNPEGRLFDIFKRDSDAASLSTDEKRIRLSRIWSFIFPEMREDYLIERTWEIMARSEETSWKTVVIHFCEDCREEQGEQEIHVPREFLEKLNGKDIASFIETYMGETVNRAESSHYTERIEGISVDNDNAKIDLKIAKILRYSPKFNKIQIAGIDQGYAEWIKACAESNDKFESINKLFTELYGKDDPARNPDCARRFLRMWQNFSIVFREYDWACINYCVPQIDSGDEKEFSGVLRYAYSFFYTNNDVFASNKDIISAHCHDYGCRTTTILNAIAVKYLLRRLRIRPPDTIFNKKIEQCNNESVI
ncbi:hypothetical protein ACFL6Q_06725, partial [Candidatus Neomarinimicrobiota bacterium]